MSFRANPFALRPAPPDPFVSMLGTKAGQGPAVAPPRTMPIQRKRAKASVTALAPEATAPALTPPAPRKERREKKRERAASAPRERAPTGGSLSGGMAPTWRGIDLEALPISASSSGHIHKQVAELKHAQRMDAYKAVGLSIPDGKRDKGTATRRGRTSYHRREDGGYYTNHGS